MRTDIGRRRREVHPVYGRGAPALLRRPKWPHPPDGRIVAESVQPPERRGRAQLDLVSGDRQSTPDGMRRARIRRERLHEIGHQRASDARRELSQDDAQIVEDLRAVARGPGRGSPIGVARQAAATEAAAPEWSGGVGPSMPSCRRREPRDPPEPRQMTGAAAARDCASPVRLPSIPRPSLHEATSTPRRPTGMLKAGRRSAAAFQPAIGDTWQVRQTRSSTKRSPLPLRHTERSPRSARARISRTSCTRFASPRFSIGSSATTTSSSRRSCTMRSRTPM